MIRTIVLSSVLLSFCVFAQTTWLGAVAVLQVVPDLSLVVLLWLSYQNGPVEGPASAFAAGLVEDFLSAAPLGFHAFVKTSVAFLASFLHGSFFIDRLVLPIALGALGTLAKAVAAGLLVLVFGDKVHGYALFERVLWIEAAYNGLVAPAVFLVLSLFRRLLVTARGRE